MHFAQKQVSPQLGSSLLERVSIEGADICEYREAVGASWDASFVQLGAGHLDAGIECLAGESFVLYRENWFQRLHLVGTLLPGMIVMGIPAGTGHGTRWWGQTIADTCIPIARSTGELNLIAGAGEAITVLAMMEEEFLRLFERLTGLPRDKFPAKGHFLNIKVEAASKLLDFWNAVLVQTSIADTCDWSLADLIAPLLAALDLPVMRHRVEAPKSTLLNRLLRVAEATDFRASVPEISLDMDVSRRTIEYLFRDLLGESPRSYFTARRLNLCKQELTEADPSETTVAAIATKHGFYELGRFAAAYRLHFGEIPSNTLRRGGGLVCSWSTARGK